MELIIHPDKEKLYDELVDYLYSKWKWTKLDEELRLNDEQKNQRYFGIALSKKEILRRIGRGTFPLQYTVTMVNFFRAAEITKLKI